MLRSVIAGLSLCVVIFSFSGCGGCQGCNGPTPPAITNAQWVCEGLIDDQDAYRECLANEAE